MSRHKAAGAANSLSKTVSWIHIGDTHITRVGEQSEIDLGSIVDEISSVYAQGGIDFVYLPGDVADDGSVAGYRAVRAHLDRLTLPWFAIVGDHDVHEKSFEKFRQYIAAELHGGFTCGAYRFLRLNAFSSPKPDSFTVDDEQLDWLENELRQCERNGTSAVVFLHCYPSDLKAGGERITDLIHRYPVLLVDMGHTHYNELSNDGKVVYSATRSTGQTEEGPVGYSVITLDEAVVSWHFVQLGNPALASITYPSDERLITMRTGKKRGQTSLPVRAKIWSEHPIEQARVWSSDQRAALEHIDGAAWGGTIKMDGERERAYQIVVDAKDASGQRFESTIRHRPSGAGRKSYREIDQDNAIGEWKERHILGTQLGPNKNGRKW